MLSSLEHPLATLDSAEELVVHLDQQPQVLTVSELSDRICVPIPTILDAFAYESNHAAAVSLYEERRLEWGASLRVGDEDVPLPEPHELFEPAADDASHDVAYYLSLGAMWGNIGPGHWTLPKAKLTIPWGGFQGPLLDSIDLGVPGRRARCVAVHEPATSRAAIEVLRAKVIALEAAIHRARERATKHQGHLGLLLKGEQVAELAIRSTRARGKELEPENRRRRLEQLEEVERQFARLQERVLKRLVQDSEARNAAHEVLALFYTSRSEHEGFRATVKAVFEAPERVPSSERDELLMWLERGFAALAASPKAEDFVKEHLVDLMEAACGVLPEHFSELWTDIEEPTIARAVREGWRGAFQQVRRQLDIHGGRPSLLKVLVSNGSIAKRMSSVIAAGFSDLTLGAILTALYQHSGDRAQANKTLAGVLLRYIAFHMVQHRSEVQLAFPPPGATQGQVLAASKQATYDKVLRIVADPDANPKKVADELEALDLGRGFMRTPRAIGFVFAVNALTLFAVVDNDDIGSGERVLGVLVGVGAFTQNAMKFDEMLFVRRTLADAKDPRMAERLSIQNRAGAVVAALGLTLSLITLLKDRSRQRSTGLIALDWGNLLASGSGFASSMLSISGAARLATILGLVGNVLGIAVTVAAIVHTILSRTPATLLESYLDYLEAPLDDGERSIILEHGADLLLELREAISKAKDGLEPFEARIGSRETHPWRGKPNFWKAKLMGFGQREIEAMFDADPAEVGPLFTGPDASSGGPP